MTDNAAKKAARKHQQETGVSYTRALRHVTNAHRPSGADGDVTAKWLRLVGIQPESKITVAELWARNALPVGTGEPVEMDHLLRVPIGLQADGAPVILDLKEIAEGGDGPHGMMIGQTGSGKTLALQTIALGLFAKHSPDVLQAILSDYKDGKELEKLASWPHVAECLTGLGQGLTYDAAASLGCSAPVSPLGEVIERLLEQRPAALAAAGRQFKGAPFHSLREYNAARATTAGAQLPPMPFMLVWVDEFAAQIRHYGRDLADIFQRVLREGRSFGVFCLFASQNLKPAPGFARIEQNTRFCVNLNAEPGEQPGTGYFRQGPEAHVEPVKYRGFQVPESTLLAIGQQVAAANTARQ